METDSVTSIGLSENNPDYSSPSEIAGWELRTDIDHSRVIFELKEISLSLHERLNECGKKSFYPLYCAFLKSHENIGLVSSI